MSSSTQTSSRKRKSKGRQKVNMVKMENSNNLQVTFSKRRAGLFKKASELCTLCGIEATILVFSPTNKAYSFAHPNVETMINRYLNGAPPAPNNTISQLIIDAHRNSAIRNLNLELTQVESMLAQLKKRGEELDLIRKAEDTEKWFSTENDGDEINFAQFCALKNAALKLLKSLDVEMQKSMHGHSLPFNHSKGNEESTRGVLFGGGSSSTVSHVPTFGTQLSVGFHTDAATGSSNSGFYNTPGRIEYNPVNERMTTTYPNTET